MRITCPNCGAQYEVDEALIPETGRDVQCSNCGKGWFQKPLSAEEDEAPEAVAEAAEPEAVGASEPETEPETASEPEEDVEPEPEPEEPVSETPSRPRTEPDTPRPPLVDEDEMPEPAAPSRPSGPPDEDDLPGPPDEDELSERAAPEPDEEDDDEAETPAPADREPRRPDPGALSILREEAEREAEQRRAEAKPPLESQPDLGLTETVSRVVASAAVTETAKRGEILPDIDKINSTLRADEDREDDLGTAPDDDIQARRRGFRVGFLLMVLIALILLLLYLYAPAFAAQMPALAGVLEAYVGAANGLRDMIGGLLG